MTNKTIFNIFLSLIFSIQLAFAGDNGSVRHITSDEGLPNNIVSSIVQDSIGFMWFGTRGGLVRYDGNNFKKFSYDPNNQNTLSNDIITTIHIDRYGNLWIGTLEGGLNKFNPQTETFTHFVYEKDKKNSISQNWINTLCEDSEGNIWIGTSQAGLNRLNPLSGEIVVWKNEPGNEKSLSNNMIHDIVEDQNGNIWISTSKGLNRYDFDNDNFIHYTHTSENENSLLANVIRTLFVDHKNNLWIASQFGLSEFDSEKNQFNHFRFDPRNKTSAKFNSILSIAQDSNNNIWFGTFRNGVSQLNLSNVQTKNWMKKDSDPNSLNSNFARALHVDKSGKIWIGTVNGINVLTPPNTSYKLSDFNQMIGKDQHGTKIYSILPEGNNALWLGTFTGLYKASLSNNSFQSWNKDSKMLKNDFVSSLLLRNDELWVGTLGGGINILNKQTGKFSYIDVNKESESSLSDNQIYSMYEDNQGRVWIGTIFGGLNLFDSKTGEIQNWKNDPDDSNSPSDNQIFTIEGDKSGNIWFGTISGGLNRYNPATNSFDRWMHQRDNHNSLSFNSINCLLIPQINNENCIWIGTNGGGLNKFYPEKNRFIRYYSSDGLTNNTIIALQEDYKGNIWVITNKGISKILADSEIIENYKLPPSIQNQKLNEGVSAKNSNGEIFFACGGKIISFHPDSLKSKITSPNLVLTDFKIYEKEVNIGAESPLNKSISYTKDIRLDYSDKLISFQFAALNFSDLKNTTFQYKLEGFDRDWIYIGNRNYISFTNLDPGDYTLKIKTSSHANKMLFLNLAISPPFWQTWWFFSLSILFIAGIILSLHLMRLRRALQIEHIKTKENEIIRQKAAEDFHDGLGHKLAKIGLMSEALKTRIQNPQKEIVGYLDKISESANSLNNDMRNFLWMLDPGKDSLFEIAVRLKDFGEELYDKTNIHFLVHSLPELLSAHKVNMEWKRHLLLIFKEAMNNALKHSHCQNVSLKFNLENQILNIVLNDDGKGFEFSGHKKGSGLINMNKRASILNAKLDIGSDSKGTSISLKSKLPD